TAQPIEYPLHCDAKTRYRQADQGCLVTRANDDMVTVSFDSPQKAITPGQYVVFYDQERCLGSGVITTAASGQSNK
ncbi:MAG: tRNA 2-thiouridine(34) synthase MnmA, partial [Gammaproteobacteria bacterium]|nr:tRNA 2-thiouridine(34) synthase MnmA [Gammaproteobacteria bacterium]